MPTPLRNDVRAAVPSRTKMAVPVLTDSEGNQYENPFASLSNVERARLRREMFELLEALPERVHSWLSADK